MRSRMSYRRDIVLYGLIAGLGAMQTYIGSGDLPKSWTVHVGVALAVLVAVKAKLSNGKPKADGAEG